MSIGADLAREYFDALLARLRDPDCPSEVYDRIERLIELEYQRAQAPGEGVVDSERSGRGESGTAQPARARRASGPGALSPEKPKAHRVTRNSRELLRKVTEAVLEMEGEFLPREIAAVLEIPNTGLVQAALDRLSGTLVEPHTRNGEVYYVRLSRGAV